ncbi:Predicted arabinose efflux permease, MFS family [Chitinophaga costaii]|uniref:Predicted arabinose efflux permease, MFS family n=1 Tax=Chitinophaga costaii TaxID=1335309 RepID=A0A1C4ADN1_9BACT|nr:MFS transporter [Chitinophaga costaii]PUZ26566.1 MFS transporter [Chitinophaga costaii]SCB92788.1 Predicted arabinose efflux permease, MFS family [Chitinophaga costaii]
MNTTEERIYTLQFFLLCLSNLLFSASFNMMLPELPAYLTHLGGADYKGYILALFTLMAGLSRPFSGKLTDTIGRVPVMIFGSLTCVVCSLLYPAVSTVFAFLLLRFFHGFSTGFKPTGTAAYVSDLVPATRRGEAMGVIGLFHTIGMSIGPVIGGWVSNQWGIIFMFRLSAVFALLSVVILIGMKETLANRQPFRLSLLRISRQEVFEPLVWPAVIVTFLIYLSYGAVFTVIPDMSDYLGISNKGAFYSFFTGSSIAIRLLAGKVSDKFGRIPILKISALVMAVAMVMIALSTSPWMLFAAALVYGVSVGMGSPAVTAWTIDLGNPQHRGRALASMYIAQEAAIGLGAYFSALLYHNLPGRFPITFYVTAAVTMVAPLYLFTVHPRSKALQA